MGIMLRMRTLPAGFIAPCLPTKTDKLPSGSQWLHEIKHDGLRIIARKNGERVRLYSRPGNDLTRRFPLIVETLARLRSRSCIIDGEAVACDDNGVAFALNETACVLCAFSHRRWHSEAVGVGLARHHADLLWRNRLRMAPRRDSRRFQAPSFPEIEPLRASN